MAHCQLIILKCRIALIFAILLFGFHESAFSFPPGFDPNSIHWETGQIIAISEPLTDPTTMLFELATASRYGHIGIVSVESSGVFVYHATPPYVQKATLSEFLARSISTSPANLNQLRAEMKIGATEGPEIFSRMVSRFSLMATVAKLKTPLTVQEQTKLQDSMAEVVRMKTPYNRRQVHTEGAYNCSEFTREMFLQIGREVGKVQTMSQINVEAAGGFVKTLWLKLSRKMPPPDGKVVTPVSIIDSDSVEVIASNLPSKAKVEEAEILRAWRDSGVLEETISRFKPPPEYVQRVEAIMSQARPACPSGLAASP